MVLHLDPQSSPTWMVDACAYPSDPDRRLLLSNIDLGSPLLATEVQIGLNFAATSTELFAGMDMGEDALRLISDYRTRLTGIRSTVASESKILRDALKWGKALGLARAPFDGEIHAHRGKKCIPWSDLTYSLWIHNLTVGILQKVFLLE